MRIQWIAPLAFAALAWGAPAAADEVVGRTQIDGRVVDLLENFTWRYADDATEGDAAAGHACARIDDALNFCGEALGWSAIRNTNPDVAAMYRRDDRSYGFFVIEGVGSEDGVALDGYSRSVLENTANAGEIDMADLMVFDPEDSALFERPTRTVSYALTLNSLPIVYRNTIVLGARRTLQLVTFTVSKTLSEDHKAMHAAFLGAVSLVE